MTLLVTTVVTLLALILMKLGLSSYNGRALAAVALTTWLAFHLFVMVPMQYFSPAGELRLMRNVVQVIPRVPGQIISVHVRSQDKVKPGQPLFNIDPRDYEAEVRRLEGVLAGAETQAALLEEQVHSAELTLELSHQQLAAAEARYTSGSQEKLVRANASAKAAHANSLMADKDMERQRTLFTDKVISSEEYDKTRQAQVVALNELRAAQADEAAAEIELAGGQNMVDSAKERVSLAESELKQAQINRDARSNGVNPLIAQAQEQLVIARLKLDWTTVTSEIEGTALNVQLLPGQQVGTTPVMLVQDDARTQFQTAIGQSVVRNIKVGDPAEMFFEYYPGKHCPAHVILIGEGLREGELVPSGNLPGTLDLNRRQSPIIVRLKPDDPQLATILPTGAGGVAAIYTQQGVITPFVRKLTERMRSWWKFIRP